MMNRDGNFAPIIRLVAGAFLHRQVRRKQRHFHLQREMIACDVAAGRRQIQCVLLNVQDDL